MSADVVPIKTGLSEAQIEFRKTHWGGSDAVTLINGEPEQIQRRILEKRGDLEAPDLSRKFRVKFGQYTEFFNLRELSLETGLVITHQDKSCRHETYTWMGNTLDGMTVLPNGKAAVVQAKQTSEFVERAGGIVRVTLADKAHEYYPQLIHEMVVCGVEWAILSVIFGNACLKHVAIPFDPDYAAALIEREREAWECVVTGKPWKDCPPPEIPELPAKARPPVILDMTGNNEWADAAYQYLNLKPSAEAFTLAKDRLKEILRSNNVAKAFGNGVQASCTEDGKVFVKAHRASANAPRPAAPIPDEIPHFDNFYDLEKKEF